MAESDQQPKPELTIGELASMTRLTPRALRHYDQIGLLQPARVDPDTGYRFYDTGQIVVASTIAVLRGLDIDVETIGHLLDGSRRLSDVLAAEKARRERDARRAEASLAVLQSLDARHEPHQSEIINTAPTWLVGTSLHVLAAEDVEAATEAFDQLFAAVAEANITYDPDGICVIRRSSREQLHLDVCIRPTQRVVTPPPGYRLFQIDGGPAASLVHHGPLESLPLAHARLHSWILDSGAQAIGCARECYLGPLSNQRTRLEIPITLST